SPPGLGSRSAATPIQRTRRSASVRKAKIVAGSASIRVSCCTVLGAGMRVSPGWWSGRCVSNFLHKARLPPVNPGARGFCAMLGAEEEFMAESDAAAPSLALTPTVDWLLREGLAAGSPGALLAGVAGRLAAEGLPLLRATLSV